jgi:hypothetical protein
VKARGVPGEYLIRHWDLTVETYGDDRYYRERSRSSAATRNCTNSSLFLGKTCETYKNWNKGWQSAVERHWDAKSGL